MKDNVKMLEPANLIINIKSEEVINEWLNQHGDDMEKTMNEFFDYLKKEEVESMPIIITRKKDNKLYEVKLASTTIPGLLSSRVELYIKTYPAQHFSGDYITLDELVDDFYVEDYAMKRILSLIENIVVKQLY